MGQDSQTFSLTQGFQQSAESPDLLRTTELSKEQERHALFMGMGDGLALENAGLMSRNNKSDRLKIETERKKRREQAYERALELISKHLTNIENEMIDLENKIADSRAIIAKNITDIDFIRGLDTDKLYGANGKLNSDVKTFLKKHSYDDLDGKTPDDIHHMLTAIEVRAIEQNDAEKTKISGWLDRHGELRRKARDITKGSPSEDQRQRGATIADRDPETASRNRMDAIADGNETIAQQAQSQVTETKIDIESNTFSM